MHLHKEDQTVLDLIKAAGRPPLYTLSPVEARAASAASRTVMQIEPPDVAEVRDLVASDRGSPAPFEDAGARPRPDGAQAPPAPAMLRQPPIRRRRIPVITTLTTPPVVFL